MKKSSESVAGASINISQAITDVAQGTEKRR